MFEVSSSSNIIITTSYRLPQIQDELEKTIIRTRSLLVDLPRAPSSDPRNEISTLLHNFTSDLARHIEGVPDEDGLLQSIRPAQERFRKAIRLTAPNFRPFEQKYEDQRHLGRASFLVSEEGDVGEDEASATENESRCCTMPAQLGNKTTKKRKRMSNKIYIDEVMERAHRLVISRIFHIPSTSHLILF